MLNTYFLVAVLIVIIIALVILCFILVKNLEKTNDKWHKKYIILDSHHTAKLRFTELLLLESKGIRTGVSASSELYSNYMEEIGKDVEVNIVEKDALKNDKAN